MTEDNEALGSIEYLDGNYVARLVRMLDHDQEVVWSMLTDPSLIVEWLAPGEIELRQGGTANLNFVDSGIVIDSIVSACEAPKLLEYSWSSPGEPLRPLRWETETTDEGTRLMLTLKLPGDEDIARSCAGWEAHLMMLMAALEAVPIKFPFDHFLATREAYKRIRAEVDGE